MMHRKRTVKVFLDSNVLFSIAYSKEKLRSFLLFELQDMGYIELYISEFVRIETVRNIEDKKKERLKFLENLLKKVNILRDVSTIYKEIISLPTADRIILSTAIFYRINYFLTGNTKDFRNLYGKKIDRTTVLTPREFLYKN